MRAILIGLLLFISCVSFAQDSLILTTGTKGYVTLIMGSVTANYQRGYLGTYYNYAGIDSTLAININSGFPKAFIQPQHKTYFCDGDIAGNPKFPSMDSLRKWNNLHLEFTDTSSGGGTGTVQSVTAGTGLSGGTITTIGTISMPNTGTAATNGTSTQIPVFVTDAQGRVISNTNTAIGTLNQNTTGSAASLTTPRNIYGNSFNGVADVTGNISISYLNSGTGASPTSFWRGDGTWGTPAGTTYSNGRGVGLSSTTFYLDTTSALTWTGPQTISTTGLGATIISGLTLQNTTPATGSIKAQNPYAIYQLGRFWVGSSVISGFRQTVTKGAGSLNVYPIFNLDFTIDGSTFTNLVSFNTSASLSTTTANFASAIATSGSVNASLNITAQQQINAHGFIEAISVQTSNYTTLITDYTLLVDATSGNFTVTLSNITPGQIYNIKKTTAANTVTITPASGIIDGTTSLNLTSQYQNTQVQFDGTNWWTL